MFFPLNANYYILNANDRRGGDSLRRSGEAKWNEAEAKPPQKVHQAPDEDKMQKALQNAFHTKIFEKRKVILFLKKF